MFPESVSPGSPKHASHVSASSLASSLSPTLQWFSLWDHSQASSALLRTDFAPAVLRLQVSMQGGNPWLLHPQH